MKIGIDISQLAYENTGVANFLLSLVQSLIKQDTKNEYVLFFSSMRKKVDTSQFTAYHPNVTMKTYKIPPTVLDFLWNRLHIFSIEWFIGDIDIFISSDWTEPPTKKARKATILYDLIVYTYPKETAEKIVEVQKRKLAWVKKESNIIFCISEATKKDAEKILEIDKKKLTVMYPGL
jgi:hypothetical protein